MGQKLLHRLRSRNAGVVAWLVMGLVLLLASDVVNVVYGSILEQLLPKSDYAKLLVSLSGFAFLTGVVLLWARKVQRLSWHEIGFVKKGAGKEFLRGWLFGAIILSLCVGGMYFLGVVKMTGFQWSRKMFFKFIPLLLVWAIQGHAEEVLARGWLCNGIISKKGILQGVLWSSLFFALIHMGNEGVGVIPILDLIAFGIFAALYMIKRGNIWAVSGFHAAWNCFQGNVFAFPVSGTFTGDAFIQVSTQGPAWLSGGQFGVEGSLVSVVIQVILIIWLGYSLFRNKVQSEASSVTRLTCNE